MSTVRTESADAPQITSGFALWRRVVKAIRGYTKQVSCRPASAQEITVTNRNGGRGNRATGVVCRGVDYLIFGASDDPGDD